MRCSNRSNFWKTEKLSGADEGQNNMKRTFTSLVLGVALLVGDSEVGYTKDMARAAVNRGDYATAFREFSIRAAKGEAWAQYDLGLMYAHGQGAKQNYREAVRWYRLAAEQGVAGAQLNLGVMYDQGRGVPQDYQEAVKWYRLAAEQGDASAQHNLGVMYYEGKGVMQDYVYSHMWINIWASAGDADGEQSAGLNMKNHGCWSMSYSLHTLCH